MLRLLALIFAVMSAPLHAEPLNYRMIMDVSTPFPLRFSTGYELKYQRQLDLHYQIQIPRADDHIAVRADYDNTGNHAAYSFFAKDGALAEYVTIATATLAPVPDDQQAENLAQVILNQIVPTLNQPDLEKLGARKATVAGRPAIEFVGRYASPDYGPVAARIVGIVPPSGNHVLVFISHTLTDVMPLTSPDDLAATFTGRLADSTIFLGTRNTNGQIDRF